MRRAAIRSCHGAAASCGIISRPALVLLLLTGCADDAARPPEEWAVGEAEVIIGGDPEAGPGHDLARVFTARQLPDSTIVVADGGSGELRRFDALGRLFTTMGGHGDRPGQIQEFGSLWLGADGSIYVHDPGQARISHWALDGSLIENTRVNLAQHARVLGGDVTRIIATEPVAAADPAAGNVRSDSITLFTLELGTGQRPRSVRLASGQTYATALEAMSGNVLNPLPFAASGYIGANSSAVYYAHSTADTVIRYSTTLIEQDRRHVAWPATPLTADMKAAWLQEQVDRADAEQGQVRDFYATWPLPDRLPPFDTMLVGTDGRVWFRHTRAPGTTESGSWTGVTLRTRARHMVRLTGLRPVEFGADYVLAVEVQPARGDRIVRLPLHARTTASTWRGVTRYVMGCID